MNDPQLRVSAIVGDGVEVTNVYEAFEAGKRAALADVRELVSALQTAVWRLDDMLIGDDGQAWKEAERAMPPLRALLAKHNPPASPGRQRPRDWPELRRRER